MDEAAIKHMADRFLQWKLPEDFSPDGGISFARVVNVGTTFEYRHEPVGTNLLTATQAKQMVRHMLEGLESEGQVHTFALPPGAPCESLDEDAAPWRRLFAAFGAFMQALAVLGWSAGGLILLLNGEVLTGLVAVLIGTILHIGDRLADAVESLRVGS